MSQEEALGFEKSQDETGGRHPERAAGSTVPGTLFLT